MVNVWTIDDLPSHASITDADNEHGNGMRSVVISIALDTVVGHLNANHQKPGQDRWRRAHSIVEQERDQARESLRRLRHEKDFDLFTVRDQLKQCRGERKQMTRERDEWKARAEADPVETKAEELFKIANPTLEWAWASGPNLEAYRRMAAHVLGRGTVMSISDRETP